jgi:broad-specificity NMP kinase
MYHARYSLYSEPQNEEIKNIQSKIKEMFDCIGLLSKKPDYLNLSETDKRKIVVICNRENVQMKDRLSGRYLSTEKISENVMKKIELYDEQLKKLLSKKDYNHYMSQMIHDEYNNQMNYQMGRLSIS